MADEFDDFLTQALAPVEREPDRAFVARVQARIHLEEQLQAERRGLLALLAVQVLGIAAIAAGVLWLIRSPAVAAFAGESPAILLLLLLVAFSFVVVLFSTGASSRKGESSLSTT